MAVFFFFANRPMMLKHPDNSSATNFVTKRRQIKSLFPEFVNYCLHYTFTDFADHMFGSKEA